MSEKKNQKIIAIIGSSVGQKVLYEKAKEMGLKVIGFSQDKGVIEDNLYDEFHEISVTDIKSIVEICRQNKVDGVVTNASEFLMPLTAQISEKLHLVGTPYNVISRMQNKEWVRARTNLINGLSSPRYYIYPNSDLLSFPCVVKPVKGASKRGVSFCNDEKDFLEALEYAGGEDSVILIEEFIPGREFSVESLSFKGNHQIIQITDKDSSGPPHFVEMGHHQPSTLHEGVKERVTSCVREILVNVGFENGATHIEMKYDDITDKLYLIEINCRGGGDHISDTLVGLSTDCDYIKEMINIALGRYKPRTYKNTGFSGICYLSRQNKKILKYFAEPYPEWIVYSERINNELTESTSNYDRNGFFIYKSEKKINI